MVELQSPKLMVEVRFLVGPPTIKKSPKGDFLIVILFAQEKAPGLPYRGKEHEG